MKKWILFVFLISIFSFSNFSYELEKKQIETDKLLSVFYNAVKIKNNAYALSFFEKDTKPVKVSPYDVSVSSDSKQIIDSVNSKDSEGYSPIVMAVVYDNLPMVEELIKRGADVNSYHPVLGKTLLGTAIYYNSTDIAKFFIINYPELINEGSSTDGWLPIEDAVLRENDEILIELIKNGADLSKKDFNNNTALDLAVNFGKGSLVKILRDNRKLDN